MSDETNPFNDELTLGSPSTGNTYVIQKVKEPPINQAFAQLKAQVVAIEEKLRQSSQQTNTDYAPAIEAINKRIDDISAGSGGVSTDDLTTLRVKIDEIGKDVVALAQECPTTSEVDSIKSGLESSINAVSSELATLKGELATLRDTDVARSVPEPARPSTPRPVLEVPPAVPDTSAVESKVDELSSKVSTLEAKQPFIEKTKEAVKKISTQVRKLAVDQQTALMDTAGEINKRLNELETSVSNRCCEELQVRVDTSIATRLQEVEKEMNEMRGGGRKSIIPATFERRVARLETKMEKVQCALNELQKNCNIPSKSNSQRLQDMKRRIIDHTESIHDITIPDSISIC